MRKSQHNRVRIAERAADRPVRTTMPAHLRLIQPAGRPSARIRRTKARMTQAQRDSAGRYSDWNKAAYFWTDAAWSRTLTDGMGR